MADTEYKDYLAARILTENKPVTYRLLSRALKTNVNTAKRMLFEFHQYQNGKKPKSVHATYLLAGAKLATERVKGINGGSGEDVTMRSSPFMSSMPQVEENPMETVKKSAVVLVREEELEKTRADFEAEVSIHIYSLQSGPIENMNILSACNHEVITEYADGDPMEGWKRYGSIRNPHIKRRTAKYAPAPDAASASKATPNVAAKIVSNLGTKQKDSPASLRRESTAEDNTSGRSTPQPLGAPSTLKRTDSKSGMKKDKTAGDIFKSFAKAKAKPKDSEKSQESTPAPTEDEPMQGMSEDEGDFDDEPEVKVDEEKNEAARKAREERAERLRQMMEDDDEDMPDAPAATDSQPEVVPTGATDIADTTEDANSQPTVTVENGRRRGRRRVMKKKKVKDEEGYLVTKEEAVWESFSEDEPEPKKLKPAPTKPTSSAKGKPASKKGQGSIASFFKKA